jgi:hypothetical protein
VLDEDHPGGPRVRAQAEQRHSFLAADALAPGEAERRMDATSEKFKEKGSEIYLPAE